MYKNLLTCAAWVLVAAAAITPAQAREADPEFDALLALDIDQLTVTSVSRREQSLTDVAAAVYVITNEDIKRMGATSIPEALRGVPGLQVAQTASNRWAVSSRGFNGSLSNKLLVMIDGRSAYTPVFSGVYWDDQSTLLEDVERIEVIRGPGASLWGANAVNGIINIITKHTRDTQGNYVSTAFGTEEYNTTEGRHGGKIDDDTFYRTYAQFSHTGKTENLSEGTNQDDWYRARSGFRLDSVSDTNNNYTVQGDVYDGRQGTLNTLPRSTPPYSFTDFSEDDSYGGNVLGRWNHKFSADSEGSLQAYVDHYARDERTAQQQVSTMDIDWQHTMRLNPRNNFIWGAGYRLVAENIQGSFNTRFNDEHKYFDTFSAFAQNEFAILPQELFLTVGSKLEYNDFTGFEAQPSARVSWKAASNQTLWAGVSRAVRVPSDVERDIVLATGVTPGAPGAPVNVTRIFGSNSLDSEELTAYEIGYRIQPIKSVSVDATVFYNDYDQLTTVEPGGAPFPMRSTITVPLIVDDLGAGQVYGFELATNWNVTSRWRLGGSYQIQKMDMDVAATSLTSAADTDDALPQQQFSLTSYLNITNDVTWDNMIYYVDQTSLQRGTLPIDAYLRYDTRVAWQVLPNVEASVVGRNLLDPRHPEFTGSPTAQIERSMIGRVTWKF